MYKMNIKKQSNYFKRETFLLKLVGLSFTGNENLAYRMYSYVTFIFINCAYPFLQLGDLFKHDFDVVSEMMIHEFAVLVGLAKTITLKRNRIKFGKLLEKLKHEPFTFKPERGGKNEEKLIERCIFITTMQTNIYWTMIAVNLFTSFVSTLFKRLKSDDYRDWEFAYGPLTVLNVTYTPNFEISWFYQNFSVYFISCHFVTIDVLTAGILCHISYQFKIVQNNLRHMTEKTSEEIIKYQSYRRESLRSNLYGNCRVIPWKYLQKPLKEIVNHHLAIIEVAKIIEEIFSELLMLIFIGILMIISFLVYHASLLNMGDVRLIRHFGEAGIACMQLLAFCFWGEQVMYESEKVAHAAYEANFVECDLKFQKALTLLIRRCQKPVRLSAGKFTTVSLSTFAWILRNSYTAFVVLRKTNGKSL